MLLRRTLLFLFMVHTAVVHTAVVHAGQAEPEIWFNPRNNTDWQQLFAPGAPWPQAMKKVQVLTIEPQWIWSATDAQILAVASFASQNHMRLNMDVQAVQKIPNDTCGAQSEGYTWISDIQNALAPLVRLGVHLDSIHMDEPVFFGHYESPGANGCNLPVETLVERTGTVLDLVVAAYPNIQIVEIEPVPDLTDNPDWVQIESGFQAGLTKRMLRPIRAVQLDVNWENPAWPDAVRTMDRYVHERNMALGVFYNGLDDYGTPAGWLSKAISNFQFIEGRMGILPEEVIFGTWTQFPAYNLPETSPTTQTWLINQYFASRTRIEASFSGQAVNGTLTTQQGEPIANAVVTGYVPGVNWSAPLPVASAVGTVPSNAVSALLGVRLNVECRCDGMNDVLLGPLNYQETQGGSGQYSWSLLGFDFSNGHLITTTETVGGTPVTRIVAPTGTPFVGNSGTFAVTPGATYQFSAPAAATGGNGWFGNLIIIWLDANGNGILRSFLVPDPGRYPVSTGVTDVNGHFSLTKLPRAGGGSAPVSVEFGGDGVHRPAVWTP
jgi:hypothetical protein